MPLKFPARALADFLAAHAPVTVLTGAGVSTGSGIPDYRGPDGEWKHARPVQFADFRASDAVRRRYWARSFAGWSRIARAAPNPAHLALVTLESGGLLDTIVTQNVDGLHQRAGSRRVIDLHGRLDAVCCLGCGERRPRQEWQQELTARNEGWRATVAAAAPDGDAQLGDADYDRFQVPPCHRCGGVMKPDVVFFGENVPPARVGEARAATDRARSLLVLGSSLMVYSGFRFARRARELGKPLAIVNRGRTRADGLATFRIDGDCAAVLADAAQLLGPLPVPARPG